MLLHIVDARHATPARARRQLMLPLGAVFAFVGRQLGRILTLAFNWATIVLFGRVRKDRQLYLSGMAAASLAWPIVVAGVIYPPIATFLLGFVTIPEWAHPWVRIAMLVLAIVLPLVVGALSSRLPAAAERPRGMALVRAVLRGYPYAFVLFVVLVWMMVVAPVGKIGALVRRWEDQHVPIAVKPRGYEKVVDDLEDALDRSGIEVTRRRASWAYELPGKLLATFGGESVRSLIPSELWRLAGKSFEMTLHPTDLALRGKKLALAHARAAIVRELTFTEAYQTWSKEAQTLEDRLVGASRKQDDVEAIAAELRTKDLDFEEWEILYRLLLQVRLRLNPIDTDGLGEQRQKDEAPPLRERVAAAVRVLAGHSNGR